MNKKRLQVALKKAMIAASRDRSSVEMSREIGCLASFASSQHTIKIETPTSDWKKKERSEYLTAEYKCAGGGCGGGGSGSVV